VVGLHVVGQSGAVTQTNNRDNSSLPTIQQGKELISLSQITALQFLPLGLPPSSSSWSPVAAATVHYLAHERTARPDLVICRCGRIWWRVHAAVISRLHGERQPRHPRACTSPAMVHTRAHTTTSTSAPPPTLRRLHGEGQPRHLGSTMILAVMMHTRGAHNNLGICRCVFDSAGERNDANHR
jgi:hypothetical protein